jgi:transposase, IS5 family
MTNELGGITIRTIGYGRAKVQIGLLNLVYNIKRVATLIRKGYFGFDRVIAPEMA